MNAQGGRRRLVLTCMWIGTWWVLLGLGLLTWHERGAQAPLSWSVFPAHAQLAASGPQPIPPAPSSPPPGQPIPPVTHPPKPVPIPPAQPR
jgi:hypothetical protein